ncbi:unnamed protein product, partial [Ectocarpus sp. 8 AP-2014]
MPGILASDILAIVWVSGYAGPAAAASLETVCLAVCNACREQTPWTLRAAPGMPPWLLSWHLRGGDRLMLQRSAQRGRGDGDGGGGDGDQ